MSKIGLNFRLDAKDCGPGIGILGEVYSYEGRPQGSALFLTASEPTEVASGQQLEVFFGGSSDEYYRWWCQHKCGVPLGTMTVMLVGAEHRLEFGSDLVMLKQYEFIDPWKARDLGGRGRPDGWTAQVWRSVCKRITHIITEAWIPMGVEEPRVRPPQAPGIPTPPPEVGDQRATQSLAAALDVGAVPDEMLSREELIQQLGDARAELERQPKRQKVEVGQPMEGQDGNQAKLAKHILEKGEAMQAGALAARPRKHKPHQLLKTLLHGEKSSEVIVLSDDDLEQPDARTGLTKPQKTAREQPGRLAHSMLVTMQEQSALSSGHVAAQDSYILLPPVSNAFLTTVFARRHPQATQNIRTWRELQTTTQVLDFLVRGCFLQAADMLAQRIKALEMSVLQGTWQEARWLELVPQETLGSVHTSELRQAMQMEKQDRTLHQNRSSMPSTSMGSQGLNAQQEHGQQQDRRWSGMGKGKGRKGGRK